MNDPLLIKPGSRVNLEDFDPRDTLDLKDKDEAEDELRRNVERIADQQYVLWGENRRAVLVVLQGLDTSGKDGVVRHVFSGINPTGVKVHPFGRPTPEELDHDFLWRVHKVAPARGEIGIFNRSHYEDVLVARAEALAPPDVIEIRYGIINEFERFLSETGGGYVTILKFYLHISREEQHERLLARLTDPTRNWKMQASDLATRAKWNEYRSAYEAAISRCSTEWAPWRVIPADRKWVRNAIISRVIARTLESMRPQWPKPRADVKELIKQLG